MGADRAEHPVTKETENTLPYELEVSLLGRPGGRIEKGECKRGGALMTLSGSKRVLRWNSWTKVLKVWPQFSGKKGVSYLYQHSHQKRVTTNLRSVRMGISAKTGKKETIIIWEAGGPPLLGKKGGDKGSILPSIANCLLHNGGEA